MAVTHGDVGLSQPTGSTITFKLDAVSLDANSTTVLREVMVLGSPQTTNALAAVVAAAPVSTEFGLAVRVVGGPSTFTDMPVRVIAPSTYGDGGIFPVKCSSAADLASRSLPPSTYADCGISRVMQSSAGDLKATVIGDQSSNSSNYVSVRITNGTAFTDAAALYIHNSTADWTGSTIAPSNLLRSGAAAEGSTDHWITPWGSSDGAQYITPVDHTGVQMYSSIVVPSTATAINVRQAQPSVSNLATSTAFNNSTELAIGTSNAASKNYVFAYSITSTVASPLVIGFYDGNTLKWPVTISSGYGGVNLAVNPPAYLFAGTTGSSMSIRVVGSSNGGITVGVSYFTGA